MGRVKNQHYVPVSYLERFCAPDGNLFVFDKVKKIVFRTGPKNIANENGFYDLPPKFSTDAQAVEKTFSKLESDAKPAIDSLLAEAERDGRFDAFEKERRTILSLYIALQELRTQAFRQGYVQSQNQLMAWLEQHAGYKEGGPRFNLKTPEEDIVVDHAKLMFSMKNLLPIVDAIAGHIWLLGRNDTNQPLYTSDSPIGREAHVKDFPGGMGFKCLGVELCLPLTPKYVLIICERTYHSPALGAKEGTVIPLTEESMMFYNGKQIIQGRRHLYCSEDKFDLVRSVVDTHPELFDPEREHYKLANGMN